MLRSWTNAGDSKFNSFRAGSLFLAPFFSPTRFPSWLANRSSAAEILTQKTPPGAVSLIPLALEINALQGFGGFFVQSCDQILFSFYPFSLSFFLSCWMSNDYNQFGALSIIWYPVRHHRITVKHFLFLNRRSASTESWHFTRCLLRWGPNVTSCEQQPAII